MRRFIRRTTVTELVPCGITVLECCFFSGCRFHICAPLVVIRDIWTSGRRATCKWEGFGFVDDLVAARFRRLKMVFDAVVAQKLDASNNGET